MLGIVFVGLGIYIEKMVSQEKRGIEENPRIVPLTPQNNPSREENEKMGGLINKEKFDALQQYIPQSLDRAQVFRELTKVGSDQTLLDHVFTNWVNGTKSKSDLALIKKLIAKCEEMYSLGKSMGKLQRIEVEESLERKKLQFESEELEIKSQRLQREEELAAKAGELEKLKLERKIQMVKEGQKSGQKKKSSIIDEKLQELKNNAMEQIIERLEVLKLRRMTEDDLEAERVKLLNRAPDKETRKIINETIDEVLRALTEEEQEE